MRRELPAGSLLLFSALLAFLPCGCTSPGAPPAPTMAPTPARAGSETAPGREQVPTWSADDLAFFLHGSMSTEVVPEAVLTAFVRTYPDLFPSRDLSGFGLLPDPEFGWPVGFSRRRVDHLGGLPSLGINCAACHVGEVVASGSARPVRVLGMTAHFDAEAYFGALVVATFRTADPAQMQRFLPEYLAASDPGCGPQDVAKLKEQLDRQKDALATAIAKDPIATSCPPGALHPLRAEELRLDRASLAAGVDLPALAQHVLQLFHNVRTALHVPDQPPEKAPPPSGPGRNDAFGLLSAVFFGAPQPSAPVKYGLVWNVAKRPWVHWDGNTRSPLGRNLLASLGLGAPLLGNRGYLDLATVRRQTELTEHIEAPRYPFAVDAAAARRGAAHYEARCASCHSGPETDARLHAVAEIGTDPGRAQLFDATQAERFNRFLAELEIPEYRPSAEPGIRSTQKLFAASLSGVWARSPYLHNGSVRTMQQLLTPPAQRERSFRRGTRMYDDVHMGYADEGVYLLDTTQPGSANGGHDYGTDLSAADQRDLIEYLKTL